MNFIIPENATREEVEAVTKAGMDAMMSGEKDVAFLHWGSPEHKEHLEQEEEKKKRDDEANQKNDEDEGGVKIELSVVCDKCERNPCVFVIHRESLVAYDDSEHGTMTTEDLPDSNIRRKKLYRQATLMINEGPLGAGVRKPLPGCVVEGIREMFPAVIYMGYHAE